MTYQGYQSINNQRLQTSSTSIGQGDVPPRIMSYDDEQVDQPQLTTTITSSSSSSMSSSIEVARRSWLKAMLLTVSCAILLGTITFTFSSPSSAPSPPTSSPMSIALSQATSLLTKAYQDEYAIYLAKKKDGKGEGIDDGSPEMEPHKLDILGLPDVWQDPNAPPELKEWRAEHCPLLKKALGQHAWPLLHSLAGEYPDEPSVEQQSLAFIFVIALAEFYPCRYCGRHFKETIMELPPRVESREAFSQWFCAQHNMVNERLHKPLFPCDQATLDLRWYTGSDKCWDERPTPTDGVTDDVEVNESEPEK